MQNVQTSILQDEEGLLQIQQQSSRTMQDVNQAEHILKASQDVKVETLSTNNEEELPLAQDERHSRNQSPLAAMSRNSSTGCRIY